MNKDLASPAASSDHPEETKNPTTENVHSDKRQRIEAYERARRVIESLLDAEPPEDSTVVWQYAVIKAEEAIAQEKYLEAERLYQEAWRSLPKEDRDGLRMQRILAPLQSLYRTQQRHAEASALISEINGTFWREREKWAVSHPSVDSMLDKHLNPQRLNEVLKYLPRLLKLLRQTDPINTYLYDYEWLHKDGSEGEEELSLKDLCEAIDEFSYRINLCCHAAKAREHTLKAFLIETNGLKAERDAEAAEIVRAREEAQEELHYYQGNFRRLTCRLVNIGGLIRILECDLVGLSQVDRAKLEQYEAIYRSLMRNDEEEWERFPIVEILDIAEAYLPGMQRIYKASKETLKT